MGRSFCGSGSRSAAAFHRMEKKSSIHRPQTPPYAIEKFTSTLSRTLTRFLFHLCFKRGHNLKITPKECQYCRTIIGLRLTSPRPLERHVASSLPFTPDFGTLSVIPNVNTRRTWTNRLHIGVWPVRSSLSHVPSSIQRPRILPLPSMQPPGAPKFL